jgi:polysaccharide biosynthesis transport protein
MSTVKKKSDEYDWPESIMENRSQARLLDFSSTTVFPQNGGVASSGEGGLDLGRVFKVVQRRFWLILLVNILTVGAAYLWGRSRPLSYEGNFKILIEPATAESQVVSAIKGNQTDDQDFSGAQTTKITIDYPTQIQILLSDKILQPVVQELQKSYPQISYENLKKSLVITRLKEQAETKILDVKYSSLSLSETKQVADLISKAYIKYSLTERETNVRRAIQFVDSQLPKNQAQVQELESALQSFREKNQLTDPAALATLRSGQTNSVLQEQTTTKVELAKAKQLYDSLKGQIQLQPKDAEAGSVLSEAPAYQQLVKQLQEIETEIKIQSAQLTDENPKMILLKDKRDKLLPLLQEKASSTLGGTSQGTKDAQSLPYQNALRQDLSKQFIATANQIQVLDAKLKELDQASKTLSVQTSQLAVLSRQYENIQRRLKTATEQLSKLFQKREELMINAARQEVPWALISSPQVKESSSSSLFNSIALGLGAGTLIGTLLALLLEKFKDVIYSTKDLREELNISILGMIPKWDGKQKYLKNSNYKPVNAEGESSNVSQINIHYQFSPFVESFRALNSQIRLLNPYSPIKSLVISSSVPSEGKTTVAIHLAQAAAAMGQRVLLVNADLRKISPWDSDQKNSSSKGLTDILTGAATLDGTIRRFIGVDNLYALPSGSFGQDPTGLLSSNKMRELMRKCHDEFDLVVYDTVPLQFADSLLLIPQTDGLLMVTSLGKVRREDLQNSLNLLKVSKVPVLGLVINMVEGLGVRQDNVHHTKALSSQKAVASN